MSWWKPVKGVVVIGIGHKARVGKDTAAAYLVKHYGATRMGFADALYHVARVCHGMKEKDGILLQVLGTNIYRYQDPDIWVDTLYRDICDRRPQLVVVPDCRFPNELDMVKGMGGYAIKILRFNADASPFVAPDRPADHPSETALDACEDWDLVITAKSGELDKIYRELGIFMRDLKLSGRLG